MSLIRLLTVSHSFSSSQDKTGRYRVGGKRALPNFGRNVQGTDFFARSSRRQPEAGTAVGHLDSPADLEGRKAMSPSLKSATSSGKDELCFREIAARQSEESHQEALPSPRPSLWRRFCNRFLRLSARPEAGDSSMASVSGRLVQSSLRLNKVEVVRNDLTDADFEVVRSPKTPGYDALGKGRSNGRAPQGTLNLFSSAKRWFL